MGGWRWDGGVVGPQGVGGQVGACVWVRVVVCVLRKNGWEGGEFEEVEGREAGESESGRVGCGWEGPASGGRYAHLEWWMVGGGWCVMVRDGG